MKNHGEGPQKPLRQEINLPRVSQTSLRLMVKYWIGNHFRAFLFGLGELLRAPFASVMTILVIGIAMAFPAGLYILLRNFSAIGQQWNNTPTISLYLQHNLSDAQLSNLMMMLQAREEVQALHYVSPDEGLQKFIAQTQLGDALKELPDNPLPGLIVITPKLSYKTNAAMEKLLIFAKSLSGVDVAQLDVAWLNRLHSLVQLAQRIIYSLGILLGIGVILIVGNTIRLATQNRRQEISVMQLVGATNGYIRRPFLYRGFLYGILGGMTAWLFIILLMTCLKGPGQELVPAYARSLWLWQYTINVGFMTIFMSIFFSLLGSWLVVTHYLHQGTTQDFYTLPMG